MKTLSTFMFYRLSILLSVMLFLSACSESTTPNPNPQPEPNVVPSVSIISPQNNQVYQRGDTITIAVQATDSDGTIDHIAFYQDNDLMQDSQQTTYTFTADTIGTINISVRAYDNDGGRSEKADVSVIIEVASARLSVRTNGTGNGTITSVPDGINCHSNDADCQQNFQEGTQITLQAVPDTGSIFNNWAGCDTVINTVCQLTLQDDTTVTASFNAKEGFSVVIDGNGSVTLDPPGTICTETCLNTYTVGDEITLTATPTSTSMFSGWQGACSGSSTTCTLTFDGSDTVTANFEDVTIDITTQSSSMLTNSSQSVTATVSDSTKPDVTWQVSDGSIQGGVNATFSAPSEKGTVTLTATSVAYPEVSSSVDIDVKSLLNDFTIVALTDTQNYLCSVPNCAENWPEIFEQQTRWIVNNINTQNIAFVTHEGDVVDKGTNTGEWENADTAMSLLDNLIPYSVAIGDHDYDVEELRSSGASNYIKYFGPNRYKNYDWYGGSAPNSLGHYQYFSAGGRTFLHIALEWEAPGPVTDPTTPLGWAQKIISENEGMPTIITTHAYITDNPDVLGHSEKLDEDDKDGSTGQEIWEQLVKPNAQVFMVLNGHFHRGGGKGQNAYPDDGEYHQVSVNDAGQNVYEMLANYQDYPVGGDGWLRLIRFIPGDDTGNDVISVKTYSPYKDALGEDAYQTEPLSEFSFELDFTERFDN